MKKLFLIGLILLSIVSFAQAAPNAMPTVTYSFTIIADTVAPTVVNRVPTAGATGVDPLAPIAFHLTDAGTGVNQATIVMKVNGVTVTPVIIGDKHDFTVTYTPTTPFTYGSTVTVSITASDLAI